MGAPLGSGSPTGSAPPCRAPCGARLWWAQQTGDPALWVWVQPERVEVGRGGGLQAWSGSLGATACRCPVALTTGHLSSFCRGRQGADGCQSGSHVSRPVRGLLNEGGPWTPRGVAASQSPSTLFSRLSRGAERTWNWGASESVTSETRMTSGKPPLSVLQHGA